MFAPIRKQQRVLISFMVLADVISVPLALASTWYIRIGPLRAYLPSFDHSQAVYLRALPFLIMITIFSWWAAGLYSVSKNTVPFSGIMKRIRGIFYLAVTIMATSYLVKMDYSRFMVFLFLLVCLPLNILMRWLLGRLAELVAPNKEAPATLIIGSGEYAERVITLLGRLPEPRHRILGVLTETDSGVESIAGAQVIGTAKDLPRLAVSLSVDEVFFASGSMSRHEMLRLVNLVNLRDIVFMLVTDLFEIATGIGDLNALSRIPVVELGSAEKSTFYSFLKRTIDILLSLVLIVVLSPLMLFIWLILAIRGKGSPIFSQTRVGRHGDPFILYKFRTMKPETDEYEVAPVKKDDPRITAFGRFLRRTSLDELPQLFNVLAGSMSLVGPRPEMDFIVKEYNAWQRRRLEVKPGITGLWQIMGRKELPLHENLEYDFYYMRNQSLMLDFAILARTLVTVLRGRGAY